MSQNTGESRTYAAWADSAVSGVRSWHLPSPLQAMVALVELLAVWQRRRNERAALREMSTHLRRDAGLDDAAIAHELAKPFWRP